MKTYAAVEQLADPSVSGVLGEPRQVDMHVVEEEEDPAAGLGDIRQRLRQAAGRDLDGPGFGAESRNRIRPSSSVSNRVADSRSTTTTSPSFSPLGSTRLEALEEIARRGIFGLRVLALPRLLHGLRTDGDEPLPLLVERLPPLGETSLRSSPKKSQRSRHPCSPRSTLQPFDPRIALDAN